MAADFQDQAPVHHVQQAAGENPLLVIGDVFRGGEAQLLQVHRPEQLLLVDHGAEVSIEEPAAVRVADGGHWTHFLPSVQELHLQVCHWKTQVNMSELTKARFQMTLNSFYEQQICPVLEYTDPDWHSSLITDQTNRLGEKKCIWEQRLTLGLGLCTLRDALSCVLDLAGNC